MELVKNIFFNTDRLTPNTNVKISYIGKFFQDESKHVFIHYGFGNDWENVVEAEMIKTELGYQIEVDLIDKPTFNFCFKNENGDWDNNDGDNYIFTLEKPELSLMVIDSNDLEVKKRLRKTYLWSKKIKIAVYKMLIYLPRLITGNYKKKSNNDA